MVSVLKGLLAQRNVGKLIDDDNTGGKDHSWFTGEAVRERTYVIMPVRKPLRALDT